MWSESELFDERPQDSVVYGFVQKSNFGMILKEIANWNLIGLFLIVYSSTP
jgi:hypothetical protein